MKKIRFDQYLPEPGEILEFSDVFGREFGAGGSMWRIFGEGTRGDKLNPTKVCLRLPPVDHTEGEILLGADSLMTNILGGPRYMLIADKPFATPNDEGVLAVKTYGTGRSNGSLKCFVNDKDENPFGVKTMMKYVIENGERVMRAVEVNEYSVWLRPHTEYFLTYARENIDEDYYGTQTMSIYYVGTDAPDKGGEVPLDLTNSEGDISGFEVSLGPLGTGLFIPD